MQRTAGRRYAVAAVGTGLLLSLSVALPGAARATSPRLASAQARAATLSAAVDRLELTAEAAAEAYDAATEAMTQLGAQQVLAAAQLDDAQAATSRALARKAADVRALYIAHGQVGILGDVLTGGRPADLLDRARVASAVFGADAATTGGAATDGEEAAGIAQHVVDLTNRQRRLAADAARSADRVQASITAMSSLLAGADADVRRIIEAERRARAAAAAQAFARRLAAAQRAAAQARALAARTASTASGTGEAGRMGAGSAGGFAASAADLPAPTPAAAAAIRAALSKLGAPYQWGASGPDRFDCSGLTSWAYAQAGVTLPRTSRGQWSAGPHPTLADLAPGDLLFWGTNPATPATIHHVALYLGGGRMVAAPHTGAVVSIRSVYATGYVGAVRPTSG